MPQNDLSHVAACALRDLVAQGDTQRAALLASAMVRLAQAGPELLNARHISQTGRAELGLHGGQQTKFWEYFGPVLGWFRPTSGPARGVPVPQMMPGESFPSYIKRSQEWLTQYSNMLGQSTVGAMQAYFNMLKQPANQAELERMNRELYQKFETAMSNADAKVRARAQQRPGQSA
ncbi:MAG: hypothetical protein JSS66_04700 [Armatimonadetes bacterium]|nr:hypothetical protein [Armatimonadota bacterium]